MRDLGSSSLDGVGIFLVATSLHSMLVKNICLEESKNSNNSKHHRTLK